MFDTWNLKQDADFECMVAPGLIWIPMNRFGPCAYTKPELIKIMNALPNSAHKLKSLYEVVAGFQLMGYEERPTNRIKETNGLRLEYYETPDEAITSKYGSCSSIASWMNYFLSRMYDVSGYILIVRSTMSGHAINYFWHKGFYYILDLNLMLPQYKEEIPIEGTGLSGFYKKKSFSGCLFKTKELKNFIRFYEIYTAVASVNFLFFKLDAYSLPPMNLEKSNNKIMVYVKTETPLELLNRTYNHDLFEIKQEIVLRSYEDETKA